MRTPPPRWNTSFGEGARGGNLLVMASTGTRPVGSSFLLLIARRGNHLVAASTEASSGGGRQLRGINQRAAYAASATSVKMRGGGLALDFGQSNNADLSGNFF